MRKSILFFFSLFAFVLATKADNVTFKANAPQAVVMGQNFNLSYTVNAESKDLRLPELDDFEVLFGPSTMTSLSSYNFNGKQVSETTYTFTYVLRPKKEGTFNIAPATVKVKNSTYTSNALTVKVLPQDKADEAGSQSESGSTSITNEDVFIKIDVSKRNVYEQEGLLVTFKLYVNLRKIEGPRVNELKLPEFDGFLVQDIELPQNKQLTLENYNGRNLGVVTIKEAVLYPQRTGKITIPAGKLDLSLRVAAPQRRPRSVFDLFDDAGSYIDVNKVITSQPVTIDVKALPSGKPASFSGAVGSYDLKSSISTQKLKTDEAVTLKLQISGNGNIKLIKTPEVQFPNDFEVYDPKVDNNIQATTSGVIGSKTIEYMAIPRFAGEFEIPPVEFSYFDLKTNSYKTLSTPSYKLEVEQGKGTPNTSQGVSDFRSKESVKFLGKDIRYIKTGNLSFMPNEEIFFGSFIYYMCYIIPAILFIVFFFIYRRQIKENSDLALVRTKKANKMAIRRLKAAGKMLKENKKEEFYEEIIRALWGYLSDKLNIPQVKLTKDNVENELKKYGVGDELIKEFMDILDTCEFARYAPSQSSDDMDKLFDKTEDAIGKMENTIKK